ncbi:tetracycline resistance protein, class H-like [Ylistrum balloti]|uniref:tetracycline resistance protein, class H-like n=1 Tax=Ylistrum balloti TaxID=509963 RepID=UPI002905C673|nr:tetracycline resistance protein, class H-like [Ylistrum balloti]
MPSRSNLISKFRDFNPISLYYYIKECLCDCKVDFIFLIYSIGDALLDAVLRPNVPQIVCYSMYPNRIHSCRHIEDNVDIEDIVQKQATTYMILHKIITNLPALVLGMFCGAWSDKYGRKLPMVMPSLGTTFAVLLYMAANMAYDGSIACFLVGSVIHGCFGKTAMVSMAVSSYVVDITATDRRTKRLGTIAAMQFIGMFIGSLIGGLLIDSTNILTSYCCVSFMNALVVLLTLVTLRETVNVGDKRDLFPCKAFCKGKNVMESVQVITKSRAGSTRRFIISLFVVLFLHQTCRTGLTDVTLLFTEKSPLSWPTSWFGYLSALDNAAMGFILLVFLPILSNILKFSDLSISIIGLSCACIRFVIMAWSNETWMVWLAVVIGSFGGIINSPVRSLLSKMVQEDEVGKMFSLLGSGETAAKFLAVVFTYLYGSTLDIFPGFAFLLAAGLYTIMIIIILLVHVNIKPDSNSDESPTEQSESKMEMNHLNGKTNTNGKVDINGKTEINGCNGIRERADIESR